MGLVAVTFILGGALALPLVAHAQVYKWVNEQGMTVYGNKPPANAINLRRFDEQGRIGDGAPAPSVVYGAPRAPAAIHERGDGTLSRVDRATLDRLKDALNLRERCFTLRRGDCAAEGPGQRSATER
jgi:hypothetical protein